MNAKFDIAVRIVQELSKDGPIQPTVDEKLKLYGWYKTATVGAVNIVEPGALSYEAKAKWKVWNETQTTPAGDCKRLYLEKVIEVLERTDTDQAKKYLEELK